MKIIAPPAITDLDGIIDLLIHPEKYVKYLQDLKAMKDAIVESLGVLETKEKADAALSRAASAEAEAQALKREAEREAKASAERTVMVQSRMESALAEDRAKFAALVESHKKAEHALADRERLVEGVEQRLRDRELALAQRELAHSQLVLAFQAEQDRLAKMKAALADLN